MYGATEGNIALQNTDGRVGSIGKPHPLLEHTVRLARLDPATGTLVRGEDGFCVPCPPGEAGEVLGLVSGAGAMEYDGYTDGEATRKKLIHDAFVAGDAWFRSGDLLRRDADGYYYFVDRIGDTFRWKGENVATQEVADTLNRAPGVSETNVYGVEVARADGRAGMAAVVLTGGSFDPPAFFAYAAQQLPSYARPAFVRIVPQMDVTGTLKQQKHALRAEGYDLERVRDPLFVRDDAAETYRPLTPALLEEIRSGRHRL
jgi:fatty-acyl-CoA synthase